MQFTRLGTTGTQVSRLCLDAMSFGSMADWMISEEDSFAIVRRALEGGINFFDTADIYSRGESETILGKALREYGAKREEYVVATKTYVPMGAGPNRGGLSRKHIMHSIDNSLKRLGTDYVDLYQIHRFDYNTPMEETIAALDDVVKAGKALYVGASSMLAYQFAKYLSLADKLGRARFVTMQNQYSLLYREEEREMNPLCHEEGVGLIPWSPLAGGLLAGSRAAGTTRSKSAMTSGRYTRPADQAVVDAVRQVAEARGEGPAQVAIAWLLARPGVTAPIIGATRLAQLEAPLAAVASSLSPEEISVLEAPYVAQAVSGLVGPDDLPAGAPRQRG
jgi:aryl-alcohol dehydrogenase-like predicted oxidoreductase